MARRTLAALVLAWVVVVVVVSAVTWTVIDAAGRDVLAGGPAEPAEPTDVVSDPRPTRNPARSQAPRDQERTKGPAPSATAPPVTAPSLTTPRPAPVTARPVVRSWQSAAGMVTVACVRARISLESVTPNDGWSVEVGGNGPERVEVEFKTRGAGERESQVRASCVAGRPAFRVEGDGGDD